MKLIEISETSGDGEHLIIFPEEPITLSHKHQLPPALLTHIHTEAHASAIIKSMTAWHFSQLIIASFCWIFRLYISTCTFRSPFKPKLKDQTHRGFGDIATHRHIFAGLLVGDAHSLWWSHFIVLFVLGCTRRTLQ